MTDPRRVGAVLLDVEGTTTPADFVYQVLFPYARTHLKSYLARHEGRDEVRANIAVLREEHATDERQGLRPPLFSADPFPNGSVAAYVLWLMDRDRKSPGLKALQGRIWEAGYREGALVGQVFPDVPGAFARWRAQGRNIAIFSSGSVLAQKLLFAHTPSGDLTSRIGSHFDTTTGAKADAGSYRVIGQIAGNNVHRAGIYIDGRLVKPIAISPTGRFT